MGTADVVHLVGALLSGLYAVLTIIHMGGFFMNLVFPITVDGSADWHHPPHIFSSPLLHNLVILLALPLQHSCMPRGFLKAVLSSFIPERYYRPFYVAAASSAVLVTFYLWCPIPTVVWEFEQGALRFPIWSVSAMCWGGTAIGNLNLDFLELLGIREPLTKVAGWPTTDGHGPKLVDTGLFGVVRHPSYSFFILAIWITPKMTVGHILFSSVFTAYIVFAVILYEEPTLVERLGPPYVKYMKRTPRFIPNFRSLTTLEQHASRD